MFVKKKSIKQILFEKMMFEKINIFHKKMSLKTNGQGAVEFLGTKFG